MSVNRLGRIMHFLAALICAAILLFAPVARSDSAAMPYRIDVDLVNQIVTVLKNDGADDIAMQCLCSSGIRDCTPTGTYVMPEKYRQSERQEWYLFRMFGSYAQYATRIVGQIMFHSLPYTRLDANYPDEEAWRSFGAPASHGCIRLKVEDAKFIAENCLPGTVVCIHKLNERDDELRELLRQSSYSMESGQPYREFFGISDDPQVMGNGASGSAVRDLQLRLKDLGLFDGEATGKYALDTVTAVREAQALLDMTPTGCASADFLEAIARSDAPSAMNVSLGQGSSGPAVHALQQNLRTLRLYAGDMDSVFDVDVSQAVRTFQRIYGLEDADGVASPTLQKAVHWEAGRVTAMFADGEDYDAEAGEHAFYFGTVNCDVGIKLRSEPTSKSEALMSLRNGDTVVGLEHGDTWSKVRKQGREGYVMNQFMRYYTQTAPVMTYLDAEGDPRYTLGVTDLNANPAQRFLRYLEAGGDLDAQADLETPAVVRTGTGQPLNLRRGESGDSPVVTTIPDGEALSILYRSGEWALVRYGDDRGYVMADYLDDSPAPARIDAPDAAAVEEEVMTAVIKPENGGPATVYEAGDEAGATLGTLPEDTQVDVLSTSDGWSLIEVKGHRGYVKEIDLRFVY